MWECEKCGFQSDKESDFYSDTDYCMECWDEVLYPCFYCDTMTHRDELEDDLCPSCYEKEMESQKKEMDELKRWYNSTRF